MIRLPQQPNGLGDVVRCVRELIDFLACWEPTPSLNTLLSVGTRGTSRTALGGGDGGGDSLQFRGQWVDGSYAAGDIVICETSAELDDGREAGDYIANESVESGDLHPGLTPQTAKATAIVSSGHVIDAGNLTGGIGYSTAPTIAFSGGGGTGATAHTVLTGNRVSSIVIDAGGTGYTTPPTLTIADPDMPQKWDHFSPFPKERFAMRCAKDGKDSQALVFDAGRQDSGGELPSIGIYKDRTFPALGCAIQAIADLMAIKATYSGADLNCKFRVVEVCDGGTTKNMIVFGGAPF